MWLHPLKPKAFQIMLIAVLAPRSHIVIANKMIDNWLCYVVLITYWKWRRQKLWVSLLVPFILVDSLFGYIWPKLAVAYLAGKALLGWLQMHSREIACFSTIRGMEDACHAPMESGQPTAVLLFPWVWLKGFETHQLLPHLGSWSLREPERMAWDVMPCTSVLVGFLITRSQCDLSTCCTTTDCDVSLFAAED